MYDGYPNKPILHEADRPWLEYPLGTKAHAHTGGYWIRVEYGWQWGSRGGVFSTPGGDACGKCVEFPRDIDGID